MTRKMKGCFSSLNQNAKIFEEIKTHQPYWWSLLCEDKELYIEVRKDNYINVYYYGGSVAKIHYKNGFVSGFTTLYHDFLKGQPETYQVIL
jgi:hypothetical protein